MNNKITFPRLATMLADRSGRSKRFSEDFLREFFSLISEALESRESVKIKGLGTFRLTRVEPRKSVDVTTGEPMEISGHTKVVFTPSKELAEAVNAPFEAFTAIEISDDADIDQLLAKEETDINRDDAPQSDLEDYGIGVATYEAIAETVIENPEVIGNTEEIKNPKEIEISKETDISEIIENPEETENPEEIGNAEEIGNLVEIEQLEEETAPRKNWVRGIKIGLIATVVALFATFIIWYLFATNDFNGIFNRLVKTADAGQNSGYVVSGKISDATETNPTNVLDTIADSLQEIESEEEVPTAPSDVVVYDTISTTRYLTTMAKMHYGNYNLWPYIYQENQSFLGHPDKIRPGTPVVIPKLSKYGVDPTNSEDIEKAKKLGVEIYARYGKKI